MDACEATKMVMSRIQALDPDNASKIMGYILLQDQGEKEMIRLAFGPENVLISLINQVKPLVAHSSNTSSAPQTPSSPSPFNRPFLQSSPRIVIPNNGFHVNPSSPSAPWSVSGFSSPGSLNHRMISPRPPPSYAAVVNNGSPVAANGEPTSSYSSFYNDITDNELGSLGNQVQDQLSFLDESSKNVDFLDQLMSPGGRSDSILFGDEHHLHQQLHHRRSCSVNDVFLGGVGGNDDVGPGGFGGGWRPCMYYARGFCKNGNSCKFVHGGFADSPDGMSPGMVGSPSSKIDGFEELLRMKALQQQRVAAMAAGAGAGAPFSYNRSMNFINDNPRSAAAAAFMMEDDIHKFDRCRPERNEFTAMGLGGNANSSSRQIYLTFPADSTFKEEDVSNYFSMFGPVQDVRIPYQQKRMFGFVTFVFPDTVKQILAKGNPHFVCESRVLVKPYKEKGKVPDKKHHQHMERGEFTACLSPTGLDSADPFDHIPFGARMLYNAQDMMLRRKLEERVELQQAIEYQGRRMMNFQLNDLKNHHNHQFHPHLSGAVSVPSPTHSHSQMLLLFDGTNEELSGESNGGANVNEANDEAVQKSTGEINEICSNNDANVINGNNDDGGNGGDGEVESSNSRDADLHASLGLHLPDKLFPSPTKSAADCRSIFSTVSEGPNDSAPVTSSGNNTTQLPPMHPEHGFSNPCYFQMPRFYARQEAIKM